MRADHSGPLEKQLITLLGFVRLIIVAQVRVLKPQPVKFAEVPRDKRRIAECPPAWAIHIRSIIELKSRRPVLIQLKLAVTIAAIRLLALTHSDRIKNSRVHLIWNLDVSREALSVGIELRPPRETLVNRAAQGLIAIGQIDTVEHPIAAGHVTCEADRRRVGEAGAQLNTVVVRNIKISTEPSEISKLAPGPQHCIVNSDRCPLPSCSLRRMSLS